ncbi:MAG: hypothetical protein CK425_12750 [Parachlamydia sp.]|nr:MAG: hypothetical protein CK425_12750 [Parachlamydia sp.]
MNSIQSTPTDLNPGRVFEKQQYALHLLANSLSAEDGSQNQETINDFFSGHTPSLIEVSKSIYEIAVNAFPSNIYFAYPFMAEKAGLRRSRTWLQFDRSTNGSNRDLNTFISEVRSHSVSVKTLARLSKHYKIHLMPSFDRMVDTGRKVIEVIESHLSSIVEVFKFNIDPFNVLASDGGYMPQIVIYVKGKNNAQDALNVLIKELRGLEKYANDRFPRFNRRATKLIFYAQTDSSCKALCKRKGCFKEFFEKNGVHLKPVKEGSHYELSIPDYQQARFLLMRIAKKHPRLKAESQEQRFIDTYFQGELPTLKDIFEEIHHLGAIDYPSRTFSKRKLSEDLRGKALKEACAWLEFRKIMRRWGPACNFFIDALKKEENVSGLLLSDLRKEYRIYVMPPQSMLKEVAKQVMAFLETRNVFALEITNNPINCRYSDAYLPQISIHIRGKKFTQTLLENLAFEFAALEATLENESPSPIFSRRVTKLIFYGHTDFRIPQLLHQFKRLHEFFEEDGVHLKPVKESDHYALATNFSF